MNDPADDFIKTTADGRILKINVDYTPAVDELLVKTQSLVEANKIEQAIEEILVLEKKTRLESDAIQTSRLLEELMRVIGHQKNWDMMNEYLVTMTKKRGQLKQAVVKMVQKAISFLDTPGIKKTDVISLIKTLRQVSEGKIYVELERARLTKRLSLMLEEEKNIDEACKVLLEIQVETLGSMKKEEKFEYILEQMRLCLAKGDYIQTQILSAKISRKVFENTDANPDVDQLKLRFFKLMLEMELHEENYLNISRNCWDMYECKALDEGMKKDAMKQVITYLILAKFTNEKNDLMHRRKEIRLLEESDMKIYSDMLTMFTTKEVINATEFFDKFMAQLRRDTSESRVAKIVPEKLEEIIRSRIIEHNIMVIAGYYTQIRFKRMAELINQSEDVTEDYLSKLVIDKTIIAKIDRLNEVVHFTPKMRPVDVLNAWGDNISTVINLISKSTHLINKERMIHAV